MAIPPFASPGLTKLQAQAVFPKITPGNQATRIFLSQIASTLSNTSTTTYQITCELQQQFDAVRVIFCNRYNQASYTVNSLTCSVIASTSDLNNSSGSNWNGGITGFQIGTCSASGTTDCRYTFSDWMGAQSIPRTDGGTNPLLVVRAAITATPLAICTYGDGSLSYTNWATNPNGNIWAARSQVGSFASSGTATGFTSTTNQSQSPIVGIQYAARGRVITVCAVGDSITEAVGAGTTYISDGFVNPACRALTNPNKVAIEYCNGGWSGQTAQQFYNRAVGIMESEIKPDIMIFPRNTPNNGGLLLLRL